MWGLFVVTLLPQIDDAKVTRYAEYESEKACAVAMFKLDKTFETGELAYCMKLKDYKK